MLLLNLFSLVLAAVQSPATTTTTPTTSFIFSLIRMRCKCHSCANIGWVPCIWGFNSLVVRCCYIWYDFLFRSLQALPCSRTSTTDFYLFCNFISFGLASTTQSQMFSGQLQLFIYLFAFLFLVCFAFSGKIVRKYIYFHYLWLVYFVCV